MNEDLLKPVKTQLDAYNAQDVELFMAQFHDDIEARTLEGEVWMSGKQQMRSHYTKLFAENPNNRAQVPERWVMGDYVFDQEVITGREGQAGEMKAVVIYKIESGLIRRVHFVLG